VPGPQMCDTTSADVTDARLATISVLGPTRESCLSLPLTRPDGSGLRRRGTSW
jgi:hypothetical protein